jgi:hypothetical protein
MQIDRINNDSHYEPGNLRWATYATNMANKSAYTVPKSRFRLFQAAHPEVGYSHEYTNSLFRSGLTFQQVADRWSAKYGTSLTVDQETDS